MRFYNQQHKFYCGIDLHARKMYVCIIDQQGKTKVHKNIPTDPERLFDIIFPFLEEDHFLHNTVTFDRCLVQTACC